jgi:hypothetical protein
MKLYRYLKPNLFFSFPKNEGQEHKSGPVWSLVPVMGEEYQEGV